MNKIRIVFVLPDLTSGGAERVMSFVAMNISKDRFDVSLWSAGFSENTQYDVSNIDVTYFNKPRVLKAIPSFYNSLRKTKPDIVISSISHLNIVMGFLSIFYPKTKFIGREANVLSVVKQFGNGKRKFNFGIPLVKLFYKLLDVILCQSKDMYIDMQINYGIPESKLRLINNPITDNFKLKSINSNGKKITQFITVARLKEQKGHKRIIHALSKIDFPYQYTIVGDGPEHDDIFKLIDSLGIKDKIIHIPYTKEVSNYLSKSDLFLQGAYVEGFPNAVIESCAVGTPVLAINAPGGLNEIIVEGVNGFIVENEDEFVKLLNKFNSIKLPDPEFIRRSVTEKFGKQKIINKYEELFNNILS